MERWARVVILMCAFTVPSMADVFDMPSGLTGLQTVTVGNPGNIGEMSGYGTGLERICGAVSYTYRMGKYEITAGQYTEFLNAVAATDTYGLYNASMWSDTFGCKIQRSGSPGSYTYSVASDWANRPVNFVSWGDAARFANWLHNGQPTGSQDANTTEDGSYSLNGATTDAQLNAVTRKPNATWVIPSEDEWYKAAYHKNDGVTGNYWDYPTGTNNSPSNAVVNPDPGNNANYHPDGSYSIGSPYYRTPVGEFENSESPYGTFDQGGNVCEWDESIINGSLRNLRGGAFSSIFNYLLQPVLRNVNLTPSSENYYCGFRVAEARAALKLNVINPTCGSVGVVPNDPNWETLSYPFSASVTLTAVPAQGKFFAGWTIYNPNFPGDACHATMDANLTTSIVMNSDMQVDATFKCSNGAGAMLPLMTLTLGGIALLRRRL